MKGRLFAIALWVWALFLVGLVVLSYVNQSAADSVWDTLIKCLPVAFLAGACVLLIQLARECLRRNWSLVPSLLLNCLGGFCYAASFFCWVSNTHLTLSYFLFGLGFILVFLGSKGWLRRISAEERGRIEPNLKWQPRWLRKWWLGE